MLQSRLMITLCTGSMQQYQLHRKVAKVQMNVRSSQAMHAMSVLMALHQWDLRSQWCFEAMCRPVNHVDLGTAYLIQFCY
jgi:hypothetical protein